MRASIFLPAFAAAVIAQSSRSVSSDEFPQTSFLTQTNSLGVVTGQPGVATSIPAQPPAVTSQPAVQTSVGQVASLPALGSGVYTIPQQGTAGVNSTQTLIVSVNNSTTVVSTQGVGPSSSSGADASKTGPQPSGSGTDENGNPTGASSTQSKGAAATMHAVGGAVVGVGAFVAAFL
jgi:hypothetical protein